MDRRVKERLVGAAILAVLIVSIVPELLPGPAPTASMRPAVAPEPDRNITVNLSTSKPPEPEPVADAAAASSARPPELRGSIAASAAGTMPVAPAPAAHLETAAPAPTSSAPAAKPAVSTRIWALQLGSFASRANADKLVRQLKGQGFAVYLVPGGSGFALRYRVRVGPMADRGAAAQVAAKLKALGHPATFVPPAS
ncbi:MAG TPA: SPOR domain-containing protein [Steroidobacteraceae bacterium]